MLATQVLKYLCVVEYVQLRAVNKRITLRTLFCMAALVLATSGYAQKLKVHLQGGIHASQVNTDNDSISTVGMLGGYNLGMDLRVGASGSWIYFQPGAHFYQARMRVNELNDLTDLSNYTDAELQVSQLKVPLNFGFYVTGTDGLLRVRASAGLVTSVVLDQSDDLRLSKAATEFSTFGVGVNAGLGIDFTVLTLDLRYEHGSTRMYQGGNANMNFISLTAGFVIPPSL